MKLRKEIKAEVLQTCEGSGAGLTSLGIGSALGEPTSLEYLYGLHRLSTDEAFHARLHAAVDATPEGVYSPLTGAEYDEQLATFQRAIDEIGVEQQRREIAARESAVKSELAGLEARAS